MAIALLASEFFFTLKQWPCAVCFTFVFASEQLQKRVIYLKRIVPFSFQVNLLDWSAHGSQTKSLTVAPKMTHIEF